MSLAERQCPLSREGPFERVGIVSGNAISRQLSTMFVISSALRVVTLLEDL
jgi:hypothetical protein